MLDVIRFDAAGFTARKFLFRSLFACVLIMCAALQFQVAYGAEAAGAKRELTLDALSVVRVRTTAIQNARSSSTLGNERVGTGVVIDSSGLILTIGYLVQEAEAIEVSTAEAKKFPASVIAYDYASGFGLLRAVGQLPVPPISFGDSSAVADSDPVVIVGFDGVAPAYVVSHRSFTGSWEYLLDRAIFTAPATVNWQGAALIGKDGKLLGIGSLMVEDSIGAAVRVPGNMFVPINLLKPILGDLIAQGKAGKPRPWLGVTTQDLSGKLFVIRVSPDSPAAEAGIARGDIIVGVRGEQLQDQADFYRKMWASGDAGAVVMLDVLKGTEIKKVSIKSRDRAAYMRTAPVY